MTNKKLDAIELALTTRRVHVAIRHSLSGAYPDIKKATKTKLLRWEASVLKLLEKCHPGTLARFRIVFIHHPGDSPTFTVEERSAVDRLADLYDA